MNSRTPRKILTVILIFIVCASFPLPYVSPGVGTVQAEGNPTIDDFEDGDTTPLESGWEWVIVSGDSSNFGTTTDAIAGSHSGEVTAQSESVTVQVNSSSVTESPTRIGYRVRIDANAGGNVQTDIKNNGGGTIIGLRFVDSSDEITVSGGSFVSTGREWRPGVTYDVEYRNIDWSAGTFDLYINGESIGSYSFRNAASGMDEVQVFSDSSTGDRNVAIDDIELDGSTFDQSRFAGELIDGFEDGDSTVETTGFSGWVTDSGSGYTLTGDALSGDQSAQITSSNSLETESVWSESGDYQPDRIAFLMEVDEDTQTSGDYAGIEIRQGSTIGINLHFRDGGGVSGSPSLAYTGYDWYPNTTYAVEFRNIDWSADSFDLYMNGNLIGSYSFTNSISGFDNIRVFSDTRTSGSSRTAVFDDFQLNGSNYSSRSVTAGLTDDFEDGDIDPEDEFWSGWNPVSSHISVTSNAISGSYSGSITSSDGVADGVLVSSEQASIDSISGKITIGNKTNVSGDYVQFGVHSGGSAGTTIMSVKFDDSTGNVFAIGSAETFSDTGFEWSADTTYSISFSNIDYSSDSYDVSINGENLGTFDFGGSVGSFDFFHTFSDTSASATSRTVRFDDISVGSCSSGCDYSRSWKTGSTLSGTVENQNGDPVQNATVQVWGVDYDQISGGKSTAADLIENAKNKTPTEWTDQVESDFRLAGSGGHFQEPDVVYAAVHSIDDWKVSPTTDRIKDNPTLDSPELSIDASRGETVTVAVSAWDGDKFELRNAISPVRNDLHGEPIEASIVIETLVAPDDTLETTQTTKTEINCNFIGCDWSSAFVEVQLTPGFYRVYVKGHAEDSYVIKVGDPAELILEDLRKETGQVADQASDVTQNLDDGKFTKTTTTTSSDGSWSVDVGSNVKTVAIQAYKAPDVAENSSSLTYEDIISEYEDAYRDGEQINRLGSVYLPSDVRSVDPPQSDVTLTVQETTFPQLANRDDLEQWIRDLLEEMLNESLSDTTSAFQNRTEDVARSELESTYETLVDMYQNNAALRAIVDGLAEGSDRELVIRENLDEVSDSEMRDTVDLIYEGLSLLGDGAGGGSDIDEDIGNDTISQVWTLPGDIEDTSINLLIHWSNGTTDSLSTESEYLSLDKRAGLADQVVLDEYPIGDEDPSSLTFELLYVTDDGQAGRDRNTIRNPRFDGNIPSLDAIELTSLEPGPSDQVDIELHPRDAAQFGSIVSATVTGPGGADISTDAITSNGRVTGFKTSGSGVYHVALTFNNSDGDQFTETIRVRADDFNDDRPPSAQVRTGPTGRYLVVGDGLESGKIDVADGGEVSVAAQIPQGGEVPGTVQLYLQDVDTGSRTEVTVSVVRGESESRVSQRVGVILHMNEITDTAVLYREGSEPLPRNGSNAAGEVAARSNGSTIQSYTEADGRVTILVENDPGILDRALYRVRSLDIPIVSVSPTDDLVDLFVEPFEIGSLLEGAIP